MCLDAYAHGMRISHDIFNTPNPVQLTITDQPTPPSYVHYPEGRDLPDTIPMWRVQTEGYTTDAGQLIGIVSRDSGFLDSPDAEWISSGANSKGPNAVALGRHGNFFHWGFAVSPNYLTEEGKDVFVNALHYISRFDGQAPIARKPSGTMMRKSLDSMLESLTDAGYARVVERYASLQMETEKRNAETRKRIEAGEDVSDMDRQMLEYPPQKPPGRLANAIRYLGAATVEELGNDPKRIAAYFREVRPYFYPQGWYQLVVDEDLRKLGVANHDLAMLDKAIELLASQKTAAVGRTLLQRYTEVSFETAAEWKIWLDQNRSRLFFTEAGGYKWLVNTLIEPVETVQRPKVNATSRTPLASGAYLEKIGDDRWQLTVEIDIFMGWHAYDLVPANLPYVPLAVSLTLPDGISQIGDWQRPPSHASIESQGLTIFEGRLELKCELAVETITTPTAVICTISYQVCDERMCLEPMNDRLTVSVSPHVQ
ncbi:MAG: hypothetical protein HQ519_03835 [Planctomycetes bacterium]|nr:hypothetical protein [Planctomycetota bacterium]